MTKTVNAIATAPLIIVVTKEWKDKTLNELNNALSKLDEKVKNLYIKSIGDISNLQNKSGQIENNEINQLREKYQKAIDDSLKEKQILLSRQKTVVSTNEGEEIIYGEMQILQEIAEGSDIFNNEISILVEDGKVKEFRSSSPK